MLDKERGEVCGVVLRVLGVFGVVECEGERDVLG